jgi:uncharacterized protein (TIGR02598 family)
VKKRFTSGFSLVELTLALGVAAFCLIALFGLLAVGVQTNRNATSQTAATNIVAAVVADLRATPTFNTTSTEFGIKFGTNATRYFDGTGSCSCDSAGLQKFNFSTGSCSDTWNPALQLRYQLNVTWNTSNLTGSCSPALPCADLKATWPAGATPANAIGSTEMFVAFDRN